MKRLPLASLGHGPCARSRGYSVTTRASPASFEPGLGQGYRSSSRRRRPSGEGADCRAVTDAPCGANPCRRSTGPGEPGTAAPTWEAQRAYEGELAARYRETAGRLAEAVLEGQRLQAATGDEHARTTQQLNRHVEQLDLVVQLLDDALNSYAS